MVCVRGVDGTTGVDEIKASKRTPNKKKE